MPLSHLILCHPLLFCPQSLLASGSFPMSQLFAGGGQSIGVSASASVLPMNTQDWSPLGWTGWISSEKTIALTRRTFVGEVMSLLFNMLSRLVITFFPRSKCLLISWLQSRSAVILEEPEIKLPTSTVSSKKQESSRKTSTSALLTTLKPLSGSQQTVENSERDGNTRPPDLLLEKSVYRSGSNS